MPAVFDYRYTLSVLMVPSSPAAHPDACPAHESHPCLILGVSNFGARAWKLLSLSLSLSGLGQSALHRSKKSTNYRYIFTARRIRNQNVLSCNLPIVEREPIGTAAGHWTGLCPDWIILWRNQVQFNGNGMHLNAYALLCSPVSTMYPSINQS